MNQSESIRVGLRIREIMKQAGLTQKELADYLNISQPAVSLYLQGRVPPAAVLLKLAQLGNSSIEWILTGRRKPAVPEMKVGEPPSPYGEEGLLLRLWRKLPRQIRRDVLALLKHLTDLRENREG